MGPVAEVRRENVAERTRRKGAVPSEPGSIVFGGFRQTGRVHPFVATYLGLTQIHSSNVDTTSNAYFTAALGAGVKLDMAKHVAFRFDARGYAVFVGSGAGAICGPGGCSFAFAGNAMFQGEVAASVVLNF